MIVVRIFVGYITLEIELLAWHQACMPLCVCLTLNSRKGELVKIARFDLTSLRNLRFLWLLFLSFSWNYLFCWIPINTPSSLGSRNIDTLNMIWAWPMTRYGIPQRNIYCLVPPCCICWWLHISHQVDLLIDAYAAVTRISL